VHRARLAAGLALSAAVALGGCSSGQPAVELSQVAGTSGTPVPTQTVTVTEIDTRTVTATATVVTTATVVATPTVTVTALPRPSLTTSTVFNRPVALADYTSLVVDVRLLDRMSLSGNAAALQLDLLAQHLARLAANGPPPGLDAPSYYGRLGSLGLFARAASDEAQANSPVAQSRYAVIRQETGVLLTLVNGALKTTFTLPTPPPRPTTTTP
jgi:energy-converting hydrogenase Eha subunit A